MHRLPLVAAVLALCVLGGSAAANPPRGVPGTGVEVINGPDSAVPVYDVGAEQGQPYQTRTHIEVSGFLHEPLFTVPPDKRAVIETVSALLTLPVSQGVGNLLSVETTLNGVSSEHYLVMNTQGVVLSAEVRTANHKVRLYAEPGSTVYLNGAAQAGSTMLVTLSGQLYDVPVP